MDKFDMIKTIRHAVDFLDTPQRWNCHISFNDVEAEQTLAKLANNLNEVANILFNELRKERINFRWDRLTRHSQNSSPQNPNASARSPT